MHNAGANLRGADSCIQKKRDKIQIIEMHPSRITMIVARSINSADECTAQEFNLTVPAELSQYVSSGAKVWYEN